MEDWGQRFDRVQAPDSAVPSHREGLRQRLQSKHIPGGHGRRAVATLCLTALVTLGALTLGYPGWAKDLWKTSIVQTITLQTRDGHTLMIKKIQCDNDCADVCNPSACDTSWITPDGRRAFAKRMVGGKCAGGEMKIVLRAEDTSRLDSVLQSGLTLNPPEGKTLTISTPDCDKTWIVNGDTIAASSITTGFDEMPQKLTGTDGFPLDQFAAAQEKPASVVKDVDLQQNYPNPFNPATQISFDVQQAGPVTLKVYNLMGQEIATLIDGNVNAGHHMVHFNGANLPSGTYLYTLRAAGLQLSKQMILAK